MHSCFGPERLEGRAVLRFVERVAADCGGGLAIDVYPFGSLGIADADLLAAVGAGAPELATLYSEYFGRDAPALALCYVQGVLEAPAQHWRAFPVIDAIYRETFARWGIEAVGPLARPVYEAAVFAPEPLGGLADLAHRTIRVWSAHQVAAFARLGIAARIVPQHAMIGAFRDGTIGCALYMTEAAPTTALAGVAPCYAPLHPFSAIPNMLGAGRRALSALPARSSQAVLDAGSWIAQATLAEAQAASGDGAARAAAAGFRRGAPFPAADRARFREASRAAWAEMAQAAGSEAVAARERIAAALAA